MPNISMTSFLKILTKGSPQKAQEYGKYLVPGGYDFYWRLKEAARLLTFGSKSYEECVAALESIKREVERKHNLDGLASLSKWLTKFNVSNFFQPPDGSCESVEKFVSIKLEPEFGLVMNGQRRLVHLWNSKGSSLSRAAAGAGIFLMERHLCKNEYSDCKGAILDLRKRELLIADALPANIETIVSSELAWVDGFFRAHKKAA